MHRNALELETAARPGRVRESQAEPSSSWYLDALAAGQKRRINLDVVREAAAGLARPPRFVLKTDLFEEANGTDQLLFDLDLGQQVAAGFDLSPSTAARAHRRSPGRRGPMFSADARRLSLAADSIDLIISTSTLDHMDGSADLEEALRELYRVLRPGGRLALTLDNPWNPLYPVLRLLSKAPGAPFVLGYTPSRKGLDQMLRRTGFEPLSWRPIVHNPRLLSTLYFLLLRRLGGARADGWIARSLQLFERLEKLPTRWLTGCFTAVCAAKPEPTLTSDPDPR